MTTRLEVKFQTENPAQIPRVGTRKAIKVNGRREYLWTQAVNVEAKKYETGVVTYHGTAIYGADLWA